MLSYSSDVLAALHADYAAAVWPAQLVALAASAAVVLLAFRPAAGRWTCGLLATAWAFTAVSYFLLHLLAIDFAAPAQGGLFLFQALLLAWSGVLRDRLAPRVAGGLAGWSGLGLLLFGLLAYPPLAGLAEGDWRAAPLFGLAPAPTLLATLGILVLAGAPPRHLLVLPLAWSLIAGWLAWELARPWELLLPLAGLGAVLLLGPRRRSEP